MNRVYGDHACSMCLRIPEIGWVYACQQDDQPVRELPLPLTVPHVLPNGISYFEATAQLAEHIQMSPSIVRGIRAGDYSSQQVVKLLKQKQDLIEAIKKKELAAAESTSMSVRLVKSDSLNIISSVGTSAPPQNGGMSLLPMTPAGTPLNTPAESSASTPNKQTAQPTNKKPQNTKCTYKVCQTCRPLFQDRMFSSFEAVLNGEVPDLTDKDLQCLPVMDSNIAANFGIRPAVTPISSGSNSKDNIMRDGNVSEDDISVDWTPTECTDSFSEQLNSAELYPCPGPHQCPVYSRYSGCAYDTGFDDGQRAFNHGFMSVNEVDRMTPENLRHLRMLDTSSTASSLSLPTPATAPLTPLLSTDEAFAATLKRKLGKAKSSHFPSTVLRTRDSNSSFGSEVEVQGGVALTEEAVGRGMPDILTDD